jgi:DMSO reductase anchor subunit
VKQGYCTELPQQLCTVTLFHVVTDLFCTVFISFVCLSNSVQNLVSRCYRSVTCTVLICNNVKQGYCTELLRHTKEINTVQNRSVTTWNKVTLLPVLYLFLLYASATMYSNLVSHCYRSVTCTVFITFVCLSNSVQLLYRVAEAYKRNKYSTGNRSVTMWNKVTAQSCWGIQKK